MRPFRQSSVQRLVAGLVLAALAATLAPATLARTDATRTLREARLDAVLAHPEAVRAALAASDGAATPEAAVGVFVEAYRDATGETAPPEAVAAAVADLFLGRAFRPVPPPETKVSAAGPQTAASPTGPSAGFVVGTPSVRALATTARPAAVDAAPPGTYADALPPPARAP